MSFKESCTAAVPCLCCRVPKLFFMASSALNIIAGQQLPHLDFILCDAPVNSQQLLGGQDLLEMLLAALPSAALGPAALHLALCHGHEVARRDAPATNDSVPRAVRHSAV